MPRQHAGHCRDPVIEPHTVIGLTFVEGRASPADTRRPANTSASTGSSSWLAPTRPAGVHRWEDRRERTISVVSSAMATLSRRGHLPLVTLPHGGFPQAQAAGQLGLRQVSRCWASCRACSARADVTGRAAGSAGWAASAGAPCVGHAGRCAACRRISRPLTARTDNVDPRFLNHDRWRPRRLICGREPDKRSWPDGCHAWALRRYGPRWLGVAIRLRRPCTSCGGGSRGVCEDAGVGSQRL